MVLPLGDLEKVRIIPWATWGLMALNLAVFLLQLDRGVDFTVAYAATPYEITHEWDIVRPIPAADLEDGPAWLPDEATAGPVAIHHAEVPIPVWLTLVTSMFLHGSPLHLAGNMLVLWIYGDNVEEVLGPARYLATYLLCGLAGSLLQVAAGPDSLIPTLGASGAIAGVMGMYLIWFPHNRVRVLFFWFLTEMPAVLVIGVWLLMQIFSGLGTLGHIGETGGVAYLAHVGGAASGIVAALAFHERARAVMLRDWWDQGRS